MPRQPDASASSRGSDDEGEVDFTPRNILITGGAGFIASHVIIRLVKAYPQYNIINMDRISYCSCHENVLSALGDASNYKFVKGDIRSSDLVSYVLRTTHVTASRPAEHLYFIARGRGRAGGVGGIFRCT